MQKAIVSLGGMWKARSTDGKYSTEVRVPGSLMEALEKDGVFGPEGLFHRENNRKAEAVAKRDFVFSKDIELDASIVLKAGVSSRLFLEANGIDTLATILVNGKEVARTEHMHRRYRFADTIDYITRAQEKRKLWQGYWEKPEYATPGFNRIRKNHCSYDWDWGPIVPDIGLWRDLRLVRYEGAAWRRPWCIRSIGAAESNWN